MCGREREGMCLCVWERECVCGREKEGVCLCAWERECVCGRERYNSHKHVQIKSMLYSSVNCMVLPNNISLLSHPPPPPPPPLPARAVINLWNWCDSRECSFHPFRVGNKGRRQCGRERCPWPWTGRAEPPRDSSTISPSVLCSRPWLIGSWGGRLHHYDVIISEPTFLGLEASQLYIDHDITHHMLGQYHSKYQHFNTLHHYDIITICPMGTSIHYIIMTSPPLTQWGHQTTHRRLYRYILPVEQEYPISGLGWYTVASGRLVTMTTW